MANVTSPINIPSKTQTPCVNIGANNVTIEI